MTLTAAHARRKPIAPITIPHGTSQSPNRSSGVLSSVKRFIEECFFHVFGVEASAIPIGRRDATSGLRQHTDESSALRLKLYPARDETWRSMAEAATISGRDSPTWLKGWRDGVDQIFGNLAVRHGIKFGLAGTLSVLIALLIRLPEPNWALTTVFVLMLAQYVGAVAEKSLMRIVGTVAGAVIGYLLTAGFEQQPVLYLSLVGIVVGFGTAMFGYTKYPYAFLLAALTTTVVASNGLGDPAFSWRPALFRTLEVCVGVIAAVLVTSLVWPRYARVEFLEKMRTALAELRKGLVARSALLFKTPVDSASLDDRNFATAIAGLQNLLHFGALESQYFHARLPTYREIIACLNRIAAAIETQVQTLPKEALFRVQLQAELEAAHAAIGDCLAVFADAHADSADRASAISAMNQSCTQWRRKLYALRQTDVPLSIPVEQVLHFSGHALSLDEVAEDLERLNALLDSLPANPLQPSKEDVAPPPAPPLDPFWIRNGVKACIAVTSGLFVQNWLNPPFGPGLVLATWVFTVLSRLYPGGQGDRRAFHCVVYTASGGILYVLVMLILTPALSDYLILNIVLFVTLFLFGYLSQAIPGISFAMQIALLGTVGTIALNPQKPVMFQSIAGVYFGIVSGMILSALVQRLIWPVLPQRQIRDRILELLRLCQIILQLPPDQRPLWLHQRLALIPGETLGWIAVMNKPDCPPDEPPRLREYLRTLRRAAGHLLTSAGQLLPLLPAAQAEDGHKALLSLREVMGAELSSQADMFRLRETSLPTRTRLEAALHDLHEWIGRLRLWILATNVPVEESVRLLGLADRFEMAGAELLAASHQAAALRLRQYLGDYIL
jgi:p-hydroxybenzoic acid efflux pump subunit AaeB